MEINIAELPDAEGRYEIGDLLGYGVFGEVHVASDSQASKRRVAIKIQKYNSENQEYIEEEYKILRDVNSHSNLVDFYGIYKRENDVWFVLELCEGGPATDLVNGLLAKNRRMAEEHIAYILKEVTKAIMYLHENNIVHRDVQGNNVLLTKEGEVKLCDFGLSQKLRDSDEKLCKRLGSPCWMAPELVTANPYKEDAYYDNKIDVWALGITAIELGEGKAPNQDMHPTRALFQIVANPPPSLQKISNWSENFHDFISECLVKCSEYRPYIMEVIQHPFLHQIPENNYHLTLEIKSLLGDINKLHPSARPTEIFVSENSLKKGIHGNMESMYEEDLAALPSITENNVLDLLEKRLEMGECYSFVGDILLYLNPNERRNIYGKEFQAKYCYKSRSENAPHIYSVADTAYQNGLHHVTPQQIVFIGESASGKTTNYLYLLDHLLYLGENPSISSVRIQNAVKLIHALIHAPTPSNNYSTRAIFKTNVSYGKTGRFTAASFKVLGLEKSRISSTDMYQGNFYFLYYIYDGLVAANLAEKYKLDTNKEYRLLKREDISKSKVIMDAARNIKKFRKIVQYMEDLQFSSDEMSVIYSVIAAIINLEEVRFCESLDGFAQIENKELVHNVSDLLEVENKKISWALTNYCLVDGGQAIRKRNTCDEARDARDVLANNLYSRLVDYIVSIINRKLSLGKEIFGETYCIKILDYFGFECFKRNQLPQFFINCFNEQLHYHFLQRVFSWEIMDLMNEDVKYSPISYYNNKDTLNELLGKPEGVLSIIDDGSRKGHSGGYVIANLQNLEKTKVMATGALEFSVAHYTGTVAYSVRDMPEKNRDFLPPEIIYTLRNSQNDAISMFFTNKLDKCGNLYIPMEPVKRSKYYSFDHKLSSRDQFSQIKKMRTQATLFRALCLDLLKELSVGSGSGGTHFVKCMRTDLKRRPLFLQKELVRQQLRALAVVETAKIRRRGYPHRISFPEFLRRYKFLAFDFEENVELSRDNCRLLMVRLKMEDWALGKTKIFLKYYNEEYLSRLYETQVKKIIKIQSILRSFLAKCRLAKGIKDQQNECIQEIKKRRRSSVMTEEEAAEIIQKAYRKSTKRGELSDMFEPLDEEDFDFIKPFALKWKNKSLFSVLMRYRAIKIQAFFNLCQQVHLYNSNAFHNSQQILHDVDLNEIDTNATVSIWLGENIKPILKIVFRLNDIPFYDTSHMHDLLTNLGNFEKCEPWDVPYQWREFQSKEHFQNTKLQEKLFKTEDLVNLTYTRNPDDVIVTLPSYTEEEIEENSKQMKNIQNKSVKRSQTPDVKIDDEIIETDDSMSTDVNITYEIDGRNVETKNIKNTEKTNFKKKDTSNEVNYYVNSKPANKDFDYIKPKPVTVKYKHPADPIAELRIIARRDNVSDDDPPFNFQGMLRKTNFRRDSLKNVLDTARRDSLKNTVEAVRRFSLVKDQEKEYTPESQLGKNYAKKELGKRNDVITNGSDEEKPIFWKPVELEISPGLFMNGVEVEL